MESVLRWTNYTRPIWMGFEAYTGDYTGHSWSLIFDPKQRRWFIVQSFQGVHGARVSHLSVNGSVFVRALRESHSSSSRLWRLLGVSRLMDPQNVQDFIVYTHETPEVCAHKKPDAAPKSRSPRKQRRRCRTGPSAFNVNAAWCWGALVVFVAGFGCGRLSEEQPSGE